MFFSFKVGSMERLLVFETASLLYSFSAIWKLYPMEGEVLNFTHISYQFSIDYFPYLSLSK